MSTPLQIRVFSQGSLSSQILFDKPLVRIGRGSDCELSIPDLTTSASHCLLRRKEEGWFLEDTSKNGLFSESDAPLPQKIKISEPQRIKISRLYSIEFDPNPSLINPTTKTLIVHSQPTQLVGFDGEKMITAKALIHYTPLDGQPLHRPVEASGVSLGAHPSNDIILDDEKISQFHARIDFIQNEFVFVDLGSTNGSYIDNVRVQRGVLSNASKIGIGDFELEFVTESRETPIKPKSENDFMGIVSQDKQMQRVFSICEISAATDAAIFISGETGSGKELLSKAIHDLSPRYAGPFIAINCAALPKELVESELFGHEKGAFTGAANQRIGAFESAHGGTLFLDEIAELDLSLQAKLLRALESGEIKRVGSNKSIQVSVRIVAATHRDLTKEVALGKFRQDLYYRLHVVPIHLPPLRDRIEDLDLLVPRLLQNLNLDFSVDSEGLDALKLYDYPGNIRELKNVLQRAAIEYEINLSARKTPRTLTLDHFRFLDDLKTFRPAKTDSEISERDRFQRILKEVDNNQSEAARRLQLPISTFHDRMKRYGLGKFDRSVA